MYINEDLENGTIAVVAGFFFVINKTDKYQAKMYLEVRYGHSGSKPSIVPRQIKFSFSNGETIAIVADSYERKFKGNNIVREDCIFRVYKEQMLKIMGNPLSSFTIINNREDKSFSMQLYKGLFQEQLYCLIKSIYE